jgi:ubiquitin-conjugating enzyme E2 O
MLTSVRPGEHVLWKTEEINRAAVVQSVDANERTARILFPESDATELAPLLELDPHGSSDWSAASPTTFDGLGVRRSDFVFIHAPGETNGLESPRVPRIGESEPWVREPPSVHDDGHYGGWRQTMYEIGMSIARRREHDDSHEGAVRRVRKDDTSFTWFGEVSDVRNGIILSSYAPDSGFSSAWTGVWKSLFQMAQSKSFLCAA